MESVAHGMRRKEITGCGCYLTTFSRTKNNLHWVKCPNTEFFLVRISCIRTEYGDLLANLRIQSEYRKYGAEKTPYLDTFHAVLMTRNNHNSTNNTET